MAAAGARALQPRPPIPSMSQTNVGRVKNKIGQALNGAIAKTDSAPATNAIDRRRQPHDRTMLWARLASFTVRAAGSDRTGPPPHPVPPGAMAVPPAGCPGRLPDGGPRAHQ